MACRALRGESGICSEGGGEVKCVSSSSQDVREAREQGHSLSLHLIQLVILGRVRHASVIGWIAIWLNRQVGEGQVDVEGKAKVER